MTSGLPLLLTFHGAKTGRTRIPTQVFLEDLLSSWADENAARLAPVGVLVLREFNPPNLSGAIDHRGGNLDQLSWPAAADPLKFNHVSYYAGAVRDRRVNDCVGDGQDGFRLRSGSSANLKRRNTSAGFEFQRTELIRGGLRVEFSDREQRSAQVL